MLWAEPIVNDDEIRRRRHEIAVVRANGRMVDAVALSPHAAVLERGARVSLSREAATHIASLWMLYVAEGELPATATLGDAVELFVEINEQCTGDPIVSARLQRLRDQAEEEWCADHPGECSEVR